MGVAGLWEVPLVSDKPRPFAEQKVHTLKDAALLSLRAAKVLASTS